MKITPIFALAVAIASYSSICYSETATLRAGTNVPVRLVQNVNGSIDHPGDKVHFEVLEDVKIGNKTAIARGSFVRGQVASSKKQKMVGKAGEILIFAKDVKAVDGQTIRLEQHQLGSEGRTRTGAVVRNVVIWGVLGFVTKGRAAGILLDTEYDLEIAEDVEIDLDKFENSESQATRTQVNLVADFKKHPKKIKFNKGKEHRDFQLEISLPENQKGRSLQRSDISIERIFDYELPEQIHPVSVEAKSKKNPNPTATFSFWDLAKYLGPGDAPIELSVDFGNNTIGTCNTVVSTKWKLH